MIQYYYVLALKARTDYMFCAGFFHTRKNLKNFSKEVIKSHQALKKLPERKRNTLLMYYFLEMTESEIANLQKITQSGVFRNRHHALETMKKILKEEH